MLELDPRLGLVLFALQFECSLTYEYVMGHRLRAAGNELWQAYQLGKTKVFIKNPTTVFRLEEERDAKVC